MADQKSGAGPNKPLIRATAALIVKLVETRINADDRIDGLIMSLYALAEAAASLMNANRHELTEGQMGRIRDLFFKQYEMDLELAGRPAHEVALFRQIRG